MKEQKAKKEGYSMAEERLMTHRLIDGSVERLRMRLRAAWAQRATQER